MEDKIKNGKLSLEVTTTENRCPIGEKVGSGNETEGKIPVISCEGGCIRGEIARLAANAVAKEEPYRRGCHGEFLTVPHSKIAQWMNNSEKIVLIDGCFLRCHGRILENMIGKERLVQFDALSHYKKYTDKFDIHEVPEEERIQVAEDVADWILETLSGREIEDGHTSTFRMNTIP
ncbi:MAG: putative zinc-binding protein [Thermoplasmata archaeon]|nr:MAG: putative zinc-binding protein [Thermoplasmata archaeon]